jgi:uncharacterized membrane protein
MTDVLINLIHILATVIWIGGAVYVHLILLPSLKLIDPQQSGKLQGIVAKRFSTTAWICVILLLITGYLKTQPGLMFDISSDLGRMLAFKHLLVLLVIIVGLLIATRIVPAIRKLAPKPGEAPSADFLSYGKHLSFLAAVNLVLGLFIVVCATLLR